MTRWPHVTALLLLLVLLVEPSASAPAATLILPLRTVGVSDTTATVVRDLLAGELEDRGVAVMERTVTHQLPSGLQGCDEVVCANAFAKELQADQVVYGSLSRLGGKIIVRAHALRTGEESAYYSDQLSALIEEDLDTVMRRIAEGIAAGRASSEKATILSVTREESGKPIRRAGRSGIGMRAGFLFPDGDSYGVERRVPCAIYCPQEVDCECYTSRRQSATTLSASLGGGLIAFRTYSYQILADLRYHHVFEDFDRIGGKGAHGLVLSFGTSH